MTCIPETTSTKLRCLLVCALLASTLSGCALHAGGTSVYPTPAPKVSIPPGHYPPPGMCRIWYPGLPPGQQPPPGDCRTLQYQIPPGAVLVYGR
jgi:hypothetical protein